MKFHFEHIGPVDVADLELGDLTIIAGRNNTGKTYLVYTVYGFLRLWKSDWRHPVADILLHQLGNFLRSKAGCKLSIDRREIEYLRNRSVKHAVSRFSEGGIAQIFRSPPSAFANARLSVELADHLPSDAECFWYGQSDAFRAVAQYCKEDIKLELIRRKANPVSHRAAADLALNVALPDVPTPFILSAERFGIALLHKKLDFIKSRLIEMPVRDNVDFTRNIENTLHQQSEFFDDKLHNEIKTLMDGYYASTNGAIRFKSRARKRRAFDIPLHIASSSARGLSDLYFYLRHAASRNDILFIDEPEAHLDTANQVTLARVISRLVKAGLKVLVSTHSDYLAKEINNLVMLDHLRRNGGLNARKMGYGPDEGIGKERIRAYVAEKHTLTPCIIDHYGIHVPVFDKAINRINRVSTELASVVADRE